MITKIGMNTFERGKRNESLVSYEEVNRLLEYDEVSVELYWRVDMRNGQIKAGSVAGRVKSNGYRLVRINGVEFRAHRVIWLLVHKRWPTDQLDHIDGNPLNNDITNLREVSHQENGRNIKLPVTNTSGFMGVAFNTRDRRWQGQIRANGGKIHSPYYRRMESAIAWRKRRDKEFGFHANHGRTVAA